MTHAFSPLGPLSALYGSAATWRRRWFAAHPELRRHLSRPVISVGNLRVGGSGKTPVVEHIARLLIEKGGERPAVLSRGFGRRVAPPGATIVSDGKSILAGVDAAGDEPLMLARAVPGLIVVVGADRYLSGRLAENHLGATVHVLDDGFQHFELARDVELVVTGENDLADRLLPAGRLREPIAAARQADAVLVDAGYPSAAERVARAIGVATAFRIVRTLEPPRMIATGDTVVVPSETRVFAVAGIARPERFFADLAACGWKIVGARPFRDHYRYSSRDLDRIAADARTAAAAIVLTTDKDAVRMSPYLTRELPIASVPLAVSVEPADRFGSWLLGKIR